ncbi:MAG: efflux RND transporter periplasmic adaptor subunit [Planctomycetota bacterium]
MSQQPHAAGLAGPAHRSTRSRVITAAVPIAVAAATLAVLAWSLRPVLQPTRRVAVVQALFDQSAAARSLPASGAEPDQNAAVQQSSPAVQAPGWLEAEPFFVACAALADGVVETVQVLEGDYVEQGQVVATLVADDAKLRVRRAEADLATARAAEAVARAELSAAERAWNAPIELERAVEAGHAAVAESEAELNQLPALIDAATATLTRLAEEARRVRASAERGVTNELELIFADQRVAAQRAEVEAIRAREGILEARTDRLRAELRAAQRELDLRIEDQRRIDIAHAAVAEAQAEVQRAAAARDEATLELDRTTIRAPISGFVQRRLKVPGDKAVLMMDSPHSAHIVHLYDPERLQVRVDVPLADASHVSVGQRCEVIVEILPNRTFHGEVLRITHEADLQKNTLQVKVKVLDPDPILRPEMLTRVKFLPRGAPAQSSSTDQPSAHGPQHERVLIPASALDESGTEPRVWLVTGRRNGRGVLSPEPVAIQERDDGWLTVTGAIRPGALVVTSPSEPRQGETVRFTSQPEPASPDTNSGRAAS